MTRQMLETDRPVTGFGKLALDAEHGGYPVRLFQNKKRRGSFAVQYGHQLDHSLTYSEACVKLGEAIMHGAGCEGIIDNERD